MAAFQLPMGKTAIELRWPQCRRGAGALPDDRASRQPFARSVVACPSFRYPPAVIRSSRGWSVHEFEPLPRFHRPARWDPERICQVAADVSRTLELERPADIPSHWLPMHGDLVPWNLREDEQRPAVAPGLGGCGLGSAVRRRGSLHRCLPLARLEQSTANRRPGALDPAGGIGGSAQGDRGFLAATPQCSAGKLAATKREGRRPEGP